MSWAGWAGRGLQPHPQRFWAGRGLQPRPQRFIETAATFQRSETGCKLGWTGFATPSATFY